MNSIKNKKNIIAFIIVTIVLLVINFSINITFSLKIENDVEVTTDTELTYYLDITYNGVDKYGIQSSNKVVAEINSDYIYVEDKIPSGLIFKGFVTTEDGTIGARKISDNSFCAGRIVDDTQESTTEEGKWNENKTEYTYHGLHYNEQTRIVSFKINNLKAGCKLTVGIVTQTPSTIDDPSTEEEEVRRDFYNYASLKEDINSQHSNTVHVWIGKENVEQHNVIYKYEGDIPVNAPNLPENINYTPGVEVQLANQVDLTGYNFEGWESDDVTIINGTFKMPNKTVTLTGKFTKIPPNTLKYVIDGESPKGYRPPQSKEYYPTQTIELDPLKEGDIINGYTFSGWNSSDIEIDENSKIIMPNSEVTIRGSFEQLKYKVAYKFYDNGKLPKDSQELLPDEEYYIPGERVNLANVASPNGFKFMGWYKENNFIMPNEDVIVYGEWKIQNGTFAPEIKKEITNYQNEYKVGDIIKYKITISNTAPYEIKNIAIKENNDKAVFVKSEDYISSSNQLITIPKLAAKEKIEVYAEYKITESDKLEVTNEVELLSAIADNYYELEENDYKASITIGLVKNPNTSNNITLIIHSVISILLIIVGFIIIKKIYKNYGRDF